LTTTTVHVRLPAQLREYADGQAALDVDLDLDDADDATVGALLRAIERRHPLLGRRITDEQGAIRRHVHVYLGDERTRDLTQPIADGVEVSILPAVSGGQVDADSTPSNATSSCSTGADLFTTACAPAS
jgi:sulfur-carrier protein